MIISLPDKYTIDNSYKNILSIRLNPDGLSFSLYNPEEKDSYTYKEVLFDKSSSYITALKEFFFENTFLTWPFARINILPVSHTYTLIPADLFKDKEQEEFLSYNFSSSSGQTLYNRLLNPDAVLAFLMEEEIYEFCSRSFIHPEYIHPLTALLKLWSRQAASLNGNAMFVAVHAGFIDIACFKNGNLMMVNPYIYKHVNDILYYILYIWQQTGMNQLTDTLLLTGDMELRQKLTMLLQTYINNIQPAEIPSEAYLKGGDITKSSLDLISLIV